MFIMGPKGGLKYIRTDKELSRGLIGSRWHRKEPAGDDYDNVEVVGVTRVFDSNEVVYQPLSFGECLQADAASFTEVYTRDDEVVERAYDALRSLREKVAELEAQHAS
jgi:hypothetical protein